MNINELLINNINKIIHHFNISLREYNNYWNGKCFHGGDNPNSLYISKRGTWKCFTNGCEKKYGNNLIGFVRGLLTKIEQKEISYDKAIKWCEKYFNDKTEKIVNTDDIRLTKFINHQEQNFECSFKLTPEQFISKLETPASYFLNRGFSEDILYKFNVGFCTNPAKLFYNRVLIPLFDNDGEYIIGAMGRSTFPKCNQCNNYHNPKAPCRYFPKWLNSTNFPSYNTLFNFSKAKSFIEDTGLVLITEGSPNVIRLTEAGFPMAVSCHGSKFTDAQKKLLDKSGANTIIVVPDNGEPGQIMVEKIKQLCRLSYNIVIIEPTYEDDVGALNIEIVKRIIGPVVEKHNARN